MFVLLISALAVAALATVYVAVRWTYGALRPGQALRLVRSLIQPRRRALELVGSVCAEVSRRSLVGMNGHVLVPTQIEIGLGDSDFAFVDLIDDWFCEQVESAVIDLASRRNWRVDGQPQVSVVCAPAVLGAPTVNTGFGPTHRNPALAARAAVVADERRAQVPTTAVLPDSTWMLLDADNGVPVSHFDDGVDIGRSSRCDVVLADPKVSGRHARLELVAGVLWLTDLNSTNGTSLNDVPITNARVSAGDAIKVGSRAIVVANGGPLVTRRLDDGLSTGLFPKLTS